MYSPFHRSRADLYMDHKEYCKQGIITGATCIASESHDDDDMEETLIMTCSGVWEMKNHGKATKQLYANMLHIGYQITVKALKEGEVVDIVVVYVLAVNYDKRIGWLHKLTVDFMLPKMIIEDFGKFSLVDAINIVVEKVTRQ